MRSSHAAAFLLFLSSVPSPVSAQNALWDAFPTLPARENVAVKKNLDGPHYDELRRCLLAFKSAVGAQYFAAVVEVSAANGLDSPQHSDAVPYVDALYQAWSPGQRLDAESHILMAMSLKNRGIAIHAGIRWADLGFEGRAIDETIHASRFGDLARGGDYGRALCALAQSVDQRLAELRRNARRAAGQKEFFYRTFLPWATVLLLFGGVALIFLWRWLRRGRARKRMDSELSRWKEKLRSSAERLYHLEREYPLYFAAGTRHWSGESQSLDQRCADAVNQLFLLYSKAVELHEEAQRTAASAPGFGFSSRLYDRVWEHLRTAPVRFETGEVEKRRRIFLPLTRQYEGTALSLLDDLDTIYGEASTLLAEVTALEEQHRERVTAVEEKASDALTATHRRGELGLPTAPLLLRLEDAREKQRQGEALLGDPVRALHVLDLARDGFVEMEELAQRGNEIVERLRGPLDEFGKKLRADVERLEGAGYRLEEPGFEPRTELARDAREAREIEQVVAAGEEERAAELLKSLEEALSTFAEKLDAIEKAREGVLPALAQIEKTAREIRDRLPHARGTLERLMSEHALASFRESSDNLEELDRLLGELDHWCRKIRDDHREERYLAALAALEECETLVHTGTELLDEIDRAEARLDEIRARARDLASESRRRIEEIEGLLEQRGVGRELRGRASEQMAAARSAVARTEEPRPEWPRLDSELTTLAGELSSLREEIEADRSAWRQAADLEKELGERQRRLRRQVNEEHRDRPHVASALGDAERQLEVFRHRLEGEGEAGGRELLASGRSLTALFERAEQTWWQEMEVVRAAESLLREAQTQLRYEDRRGFGYGVRTDCRAARQLLEEAERDHASRRWDEVVSKAQRAKRDIEEEVSRCRRQARQIEEARRRNAERLRRQQEWELARRRSRESAVVLGEAMGKSASRSPASPARPPRLPRRKPSVGPSFGSSFANRGGSSFSGTRSGGSSW